MDQKFVRSSGGMISMDDDPEKLAWEGILIAMIIWYAGYVIGVLVALKFVAGR